MFSKSSNSVPLKGHQQLTGDQADEQDRIIAGVQFNVRYVGSTEVAGFNGTGSGKTEIPVAQIFHQQKQKGENKNSRKMLMTLCSKSLSVSEESSGRLVANFPIDKVTFCNVDVNRERVFVFIARHGKEAPFKAFVFLCESKTKAREAFDALKLAFMINYECVQASRVRNASIRASAASSYSTTPEDKPVPKSTAVSGAGKENRASCRENGDTDHGVITTPVVSSYSYSPPGCYYEGTPLQVKRYPNMTCENSAASVPYAAVGIFPDGVRSPGNRPGGGVCGDDDFDAEFTQFAELRSRSSSDDANGGGGFAVACQGYNVEALGGFKAACLPMH